ncbi:MAG: SDR family NAD(P)-dependent oxidoreductase [Gemmatimonadota bacterium]|nr:SDR family NAD(P)-dependent oxidoreductase [Gemmatimonadota bacterium]
MRVLITGGAGFIGSHTADGLIGAGHTVRILDSLHPRVHRGGVPEYLSSDAEFIKGDVRSRDDMTQALQGVDAVIHLAAYQDYMTDFSQFFDTNTTGSALLYELVVEHNLPIEKIIVASSQAVYGEGPYTCQNAACSVQGVQWPASRTEDQLEKGQWDILCPGCGAVLQHEAANEAHVNPGNSYAISKYAQEMIGLALGRRYGIPTTAMRYSIVQGPRQSFLNAYSGVCRIFSLRMHLGYPPMAYEDGGQLRDYVNIGDVVRANMLVLEHPATDGEVYNVGGGQTVSVLDFARVLIGTFGKNVAPEIPGKYRFGDTRHILSDISKLTKLGWIPRVNVNLSVRDYVDWLVAQPGLEDFIATADRTMEQRQVVREVRA